MPGDVRQNLSRHLELVERLPRGEPVFLLFPELSLTGYEPALADPCAVAENTPLLDGLEDLCRAREIKVAVGAPIQGNGRPYIGMLILGGPERQLYRKQHLHPDEEPFFEPGATELRIDLGDCVLQPAICYESVLPSHAQAAVEAGANVYAASVAKHQEGVEKALPHYRRIACEHRMTVLLSNCVGPCDNHVAGGCSCIIAPNGEVVRSLGPTETGLLVWEFPGTSAKD